MAQASNAPAREPSMEEILASIRRIIEDSDSARRSADDLHDDSLVEAPTTVDAYADFRQEEEIPGPEVEAFRSELAQPSTIAVVTPAPKPAEPVRHVNGIHPAVNGFGHGHTDNGRAAPEKEKRAEPTPAAVEPREETRPREDVGASRGAIISDFAGRQVAAAFEELSEAFSASRKRSYDEIAEEIMRPMLQEWLDNNLPLLVERLVREEIERVARGGVR